ncbi:MAG TPA: hypothetical protein VH333_23415 [Pseudonocardiaceae bacterium]|jgi:hypothetical protein|nr:hypothetical protein [Pseudonocardiaceae bacterium]
MTQFDDPRPRSWRAMRVLLLAASVLTASYWIAWYADRSLVASNATHGYYDFENAFPLADAWLAFCLVAAAVQLTRTRPSSLLWLLLSAGAGGYLFGMDVLYDIEHGIWTSGAGGAFEALLNVLTLVISVIVVSWAWRNRHLLSPVRSGRARVPG